MENDIFFLLPPSYINNPVCISVCISVCQSLCLSLPSLFPFTSKPDEVILRYPGLTALYRILEVFQLTLTLINV